jgi:hypothetical protein
MTYTRVGVEHFGAARVRGYETRDVENKAADREDHWPVGWVWLGEFVLGNVGQRHPRTAAAVLPADE